MSNVAFALLGTASVVILAVWMAIGARRMLGLRVSGPRMVLAALVGYSASAVFGTVVRPPMERSLLASVMIGVSVLAAMGFLILADLVAPVRSRPVDWTRRLHRRVGRTRRYARIASIIFRHGLAPFLRRSGRSRRDRSGDTDRHRPAHSLRLALEEGGVTFVKLGQLLSTRPDVLPPGFIEELSNLQHRVPPAPWEEVHQVLIEELGALADQVFAHVEHEPVAAGSVAQVHRARLRTGAEVVVKIQRPGIRPVVERDLDILHRLAQVAEERAHWARSIGAVALAKGFAGALREEMDFETEARNMAAITAGERSGATGVTVPAVHENLCTKRVLVMEYLDGTPLGSAEELIERRGLDREKLAGILLNCFLRQVMTQGVFHCDPHPGNILIRPDGGLALLDFGVVGRIDSQTRSSLQSLLLAFKRGDRAALCDALLDVVERSDELDEGALERALGDFAAQHLGPTAGVDLEMFTQLFRVVADHGLTVPPQIAAVFRTLTTLHGTLAQLSPDFDIVTEARVLATEYSTEKLRPSSLREAVEEDLLELLPMLRRLPRRLDRITSSLEEGRMSVTVRVAVGEQDRRRLTGLVHLAVLTGFCAAAGIIAAMLLTSSVGPRLTPSLTLPQLIGYNLLVLSSVLGLRVLVRVFRGDG